MPELGQIHLNIANVLKNVAKNRSVISYEDLVKESHYPYSIRKAGDDLEKLDNLSFSSFCTFVSVLVVLKSSVDTVCPVPSMPFFTAYRRRTGETDMPCEEFATKYRARVYNKVIWDEFLLAIQDAMM